MSKKIVLDAGHGGNDPGAVGNGLKEKDLTLNIVKGIQKYLNDNYEGHEIKLTRSNDRYLTLSQRAKIANDWKADLFVSVHINSGGGTGYEDFIHNNLTDSSNTAKLRNVFHNEVVKNQSFWKNRGKKKANFAVLRETKMSAILSENGFIDTKADSDKLKSDSHLNKIVIGHGEGIAKALQLKKKATKKPVANKPTGKKLYRVQVGAFSKRSNAENLQKKLQKDGYDTIIKYD